MMHVPIARHVEKSSACLTAITPAIRTQIDAINATKLPKNGIKEKNLRMPGEVANEWVIMTTTVDTEAMTLMASTDQFSTWIIMVNESSAEKMAL